MSASCPGISAFMLMIFILWGSGVAQAAKPLVMSIGDLGQPVSPGSPTTYFDLLKLIFPDLEKPQGTAYEAAAGETAPVRHIEGDYNKQAVTGSLRFLTFSSLPVMARNRKLMLLHVDVSGEGRPVCERPGEGYSLLAVIEPGPPPRLLDLLDIRADRSNGFWTDNPLMNLSQGTQAVMINHSHSNSNQSYNIIRLLFVRNGSLEEICRVNPFAVTSLCRTFASEAVFWTVPEKDQEYPPVVAAVTLQMQPSPQDEECRPRQPGFTRRYQATWRWNGKKYQQMGGNLDKLYRFYEKYY